VTTLSVFAPGSAAPSLPHSACQKGAQQTQLAGVVGDKRAHLAQNLHLLQYQAVHLADLVLMDES